MNTTEKLNALYAKIPDIKCKGLCHTSCGPITMSKAEKARIIKRVGHNPFEPLEGMHINALKELSPGCLTCPLLEWETKRCTIYDIRPLICRLYGVVKGMPCPYGCKPKRYLKNIEGKTLIKDAFLIISRSENL